MAYRPYRPRGVSPRLQDVMEKLAGRESSAPAHTPIAYSPADILAAKTVLDRLLAQAESNEVASITPIVRESDED